MKFRKKPIVIEAFQWDGRWITDANPAWISYAMNRGDAAVHSDGEGPNLLVIRTLEGDMRANPGDWIIRGVKGELYPCKPDIFAATYEPA